MPHVGFVVLIVLGGFVGWIAGMILRLRHSVFANILVGVAGSWIGAGLANMANVVTHHTLVRFLAALVGSAALLYIWGMINKRA